MTDFRTRNECAALHQLVNLNLHVEGHLDRNPGASSLPARARVTRCGKTRKDGRCSVEHAGFQVRTHARYSSPTQLTHSARRPIGNSARGPLPTRTNRCRHPLQAESRQDLRLASPARPEPPHGDEPELSAHRRIALSASLRGVGQELDARRPRESQFRESRERRGPQGPKRKPRRSPGRAQRRGDLEVRGRGLGRGDQNSLSSAASALAEKSGSRLAERASLPEATLSRISFTRRTLS